jgi:hypothetical protein
MLRLNTSTPALPAAQQNNLGVIAGDLAGFPNGRRLEDDVTDIAIRAVAGGYGATLAAPPFNLPNFSPNNALGDGVNQNDTVCLSSFPYVGTPHDGYYRNHSALYGIWLLLVSKPSGTTVHHN